MSFSYGDGRQRSIRSMAQHVLLTAEHSEIRTGSTNSGIDLAQFRRGRALLQPGQRSDPPPRSCRDAGAEIRDSTGVRRRLERDGFGREAWWWFASAYIDGRQRVRRWSVDKHGDRGAWLLAMAQRLEWEKSI